jgi:hypothetical protein
MTRKETLAKHKEQIKLETIEIRSLKERNRILSRNHSLGWLEINELIEIRQQNSLRHYWYYRLKNLYTERHGKSILTEINKDYPHYTAVYLNEKGAEEYLLGRI